MKKLLSEAHVIQVFKEEHEKHLTKIREEIDMYFKHSGDVDNVISPELKVRKKDDKVLYTIDSVSPRDVVLRAPEGSLVKVSQSQLEKDFEID